MNNEAVESNAAAVVAGVGAREGVGGAVCARLAQAGLHVYAVGRNAEKLTRLVDEIAASPAGATAVCSDTTDPEAVNHLFDQIEGDGRVPDMVVFNASELNLPKPLLEMTPDYVENMWRVCCFGGFLVGQEAIRRMLPQQRGTIVFTGATASLRGAKGFSAFAAAKAGLRTHAQSMAREFGPQGIHVSHVVIDGGVDGRRLRDIEMGQKMLVSKGDNGALQPDAIAEAYWQLRCQHPSAWTHELDLRPFKESF